MRNKYTKKESKLVPNPRIARKLLKMNGEIKFCPYCGARIEDGCECHKNIVVDIKPYKDRVTGIFEPDKTVFVFNNNTVFQEDYAQIKDEIEAREAEFEVETETEFEFEFEIEPLVIDLD